MATLLDRIRIVLIQPLGARNVGSIARVMKNMGLSQLWIVQPECDIRSEEARRMSVRAANILATAQICDSLATALAGCSVAVATIGRDVDRLIETPRTGMEKLVSTVAHTSSEFQGAIIFGREDHGLSNADLDQAQIYVSIPANAEYPSLNLAQAVGILAYELHLAVAAPLQNAIVKPVDEVVDLAQVEGYFQDLEALLLEIGFLQEHTAASRIAKLRDLLKRGNPSAAEVAMLRGIIRQVKWAARSQSIES
ncbi:RNA methyltransferase [filamentous cyanobacterium LEGE 11480]|uniref:tRNA (cytidine/uridine-2'-O-)-methyltransferase TrmJ n=1 Tax=Romeriopsis navalis LEGE 11480 TaxID=2777977 RepID=A0A928VT25_9CYAN|nr:RNA methyltransferase [Romeriopsis navalis]MBE9031724.1 RNA methyltransferase [Romeriopsis navalis LEGE 11480]